MATDLDQALSDLSIIRLDLLDLNLGYQVASFVARATERIKEAEDLIERAIAKDDELHPEG